MGRKRKARIYTSSPAPNNIGPMDAHVNRKVPQTDSESATLEVSLSPGNGPTAPPQPPGAILVEGTIEDSQVSVSKGEGDSLIPESSSDGISQRTVDKATPGAPCKSLLSPKEPSDITLRDLWKMLVRLDSNVSQVNDFLTSLVNVNRGSIEEQGRKLMELESAMKTISSNVQNIQNAENMHIVDSLSLHSELENIENMLRIKNLRLVNFPVTRLLSPYEMFKKFLIENLSYEVDKIPSISKIFYFPLQTRSSHNGDPEKSPGISSFLEESLDIINKRTTLFVFFSLEREKDQVFEKFFRNKECSFCGQRVYVFPDVSRPTQARRRQFLALKSKALEIGATFYFKFPSKCYINFQGNKFIFSDPLHLETFLVDESEANKV